MRPYFPGNPALEVLSPERYICCPTSPKLIIPFCLSTLSILIVGTPSTTLFSDPRLTRNQNLLANKELWMLSCLWFCCLLSALAINRVKSLLSPSNFKTHELDACHLHIVCNTIHKYEYETLTEMVTTPLKQSMNYFIQVESELSVASFFYSRTMKRRIRIYLNCIFCIFDCNISGRATEVR